MNKYIGLGLVLVSLLGFIGYQKLQISNVESKLAQSEFDVASLTSQLNGSLLRNQELLKQVEASDLAINSYQNRVKEVVTNRNKLASELTKLKSENSDVQKVLDTKLPSSLLSRLQ